MHLLSLRDLQSPERTAIEDRSRARCSVAPVDPVTAVCRVLGRYKFYVDTRDIGIAAHLMLDGYWELWQTEFILRNVAAGQVVADVGAHIGYFTILMADLVGSTGKVHAFEPNRRLFGLLENNVSVNGYPGRVAARRTGVAEDAAAEIPFLVQTRDPKNGCIRVGQEAGLGAFDPEQYESYSVPAAPLDTLIPGPVDFLKIDVEGAEELVWRGMQGLIARSPNIRMLLEFNPKRCTAPSETLASIAARFPLRRLGLDGQVSACDTAAILAEAEDTILYLSKLPPL
ncbi:MAG: FkbM family methyltransferase [Pseudomonadota bacterium]